MSELSSKFSKIDIETLIEAIGDWELLGNQEFNFLKMIEGAPMPPEDNEAFEVMNNIKNHYKKKKSQILDHRELRQEKAVFLKAKLMMVRRQMGLQDVFEMAGMSEEEIAESKAQNTTMTIEAAPEPSGNSKALPDPFASQAKSVHPSHKKLLQAEFFMKDLGVWLHYQDFLKKEAAKDETPPPLEISEN